MDTKEKIKIDNNWPHKFFDKPLDEISDKELIDVFRDSNRSMAYCFGGKDVSKIDILSAELENRGFELEEYTECHITIGGDEPEFDAKGNALKEDEED